MSGVELAGLALAVLPLLVSAIEHYDDILKPLRAYRGFSSKLKRLNDDLTVQRTIFRTECLLLLAPVSTSTTAQAMLSDPRHEAWESVTLERVLNERFGPLASSCQLVVKRINAHLKSIAEVLSKIIDVTSLPHDAPTSIRKEWKKIFGSRLKFSFTEGDVNRSVLELAASIGTFRALSGQIDRLRRNTTLLDTQSQRPNASLEPIEEIRLVGQRSLELYRGLCKACRKHQEHPARLQIPIVHRFEKKAGNTSQSLRVIQYDMTYKMSLAVSHVNNCQVVLVGGEDIAGSQVLPEGSASIMRQGNVVEGRDSSFSIELVGPARVTGPEPDASGTSSAPVQEQQTKQTSQLDLCIALATRAPGVTLQPSETRLRMLDQEVRLQLKRADDAQHQMDFALSDLFDTLPPARHRPRLPTWQRLYLARHLVLMVLQLHSTPWLHIPINSNNIRIDTASKSTSKGPYRDAKLLIDVNIGERAKSWEPVKCHQARARNTVLFNLGIMLLELAYCDTFKTLRANVDQTALVQGAADQDEYIAELLLDDVAIDMGAEYCTATRKLLDCDFGAGRDLNDLQLQSRIYADIVERLKDLEDGFRRLQCGPGA